MNPYEPLKPVSNSADAVMAGSTDAITIRFLFTPEHLVETLHRYRLQHRGRRVLNWFRCFSAFIFLLIAVIGFFVPQYLLSLFMIAVAVFMFFPHKIDNFLAIRSFRKSPHCNTEQLVQLSEDGLYSKSEVQESTLQWAAFSKAVVFHDGVLIFQGPKIVHWFPDRIFEVPSDAHEFLALVELKLPTSRRLRQSSREPAS